MHGLIRVRQFTISEAIWRAGPTSSRMNSGLPRPAIYMLDTLGLGEDVSYRFSKWDENNKDKYIGSAEQWESVQNRMRTILDHIGIDYVEADGEAAFYGRNSTSRYGMYTERGHAHYHQIDFQLAERFGMVYVDSDGSKKYPYVIHRTSIGCYERTLAL